MASDRKLNELCNLLIHIIEMSKNSIGPVDFGLKTQQYAIKKPQLLFDSCSAIHRLALTDQFKSYGHCLPINLNRET